MAIIIFSFGPKFLSKINLFKQVLKSIYVKFLYLSESKYKSLYEFSASIPYICIETLYLSKKNSFLFDSTESLYNL